MPKYKLKSKSYITSPTGEAIPFCDVPQKEKEEMFKRMNQRLSEELSIYCTQHPEEYEKLCKREKNT